MGIVGNVVVFSCSWWIFFFMIASRDFQKDINPMVGSPKSAPKSFSFKDKFFKTTKITVIFCLIINIIVLLGGFEWILEY